MFAQLIVYAKDAIVSDNQAGNYHHARGRHYVYEAGATIENTVIKN